MGPAFPAPRDLAVLTIACGTYDMAATWFMEAIDRARRTCTGWTGTVVDPIFMLVVQDLIVGRHGTVQAIRCNKRGQK